MFFKNNLLIISNHPFYKTNIKKSNLYKVTQTL